MPEQIAGRVLDAAARHCRAMPVTVESSGRKQQLFTATDGSYVATSRPARS
jgi:hypothetical protein